MFHRIAQLTKIPFGSNEPLLERALIAGGIGLWDYVPATRQIDLYHNVLAFQRLKPGRYCGPVADFIAYVGEEEKRRLEALVEACDASVELIEVEFRVTTANDTEIWLACRGRRTQDEGGETRYVGTLLDITDRTERELRSLRYHEALFSLARSNEVVAAETFLQAAKTILIEAAQELRVARSSLWQFSDATHLTINCTYSYDERGDSSGESVLQLTNETFPTYLEAVRQRRALAVEDALIDPVLIEFRPEYLPATGVRALLDIPVFRAGELWGIVCFEDVAQTRPWYDEEQTFASSCVDLISLTLERSERRSTERALAQTQERHRAFVQASPDPIWCVDIDPPIAISETPDTQIEQLKTRGRLTDANAAFKVTFPKSENGLFGRALAESMPKLFKGSSLRDWIDGGYKLIERELVNRKQGGAGNERWIAQSLLGIVEDGRLTRIWGARRNITDRKRYQRLLEHLAYKDPLTGLLNRQRMLDEISETLSARNAEVHPTPCCLLLIDLNLFKDINDTLGHAAGDQVLRQMRGRLTQATFEVEAFVARLGGDEFAIFAPNVSTSDGAMELADAVTEAMAEPFAIGGGKFHVSASIGAALFPAHGTTFSDLSRAADEAMYHAKNTGGGARVFSRTTDVFEQRKLGLLSRLPAAIELGELTLEYQPITEVATRKAIRMEALVRWNHPEYGKLGAQDFIHKAEMSDAIRQLTRWVIDRATQACKGWQSQSPGVGVSINISPRLLGDRAIVTHLQAAVSETALSPSLVDLEITETSLIHNEEQAAQVLSDCQRLGFSIMIDDYGVGFCSLAYLRRLPVRGLKIDRSFVDRMSKNKEDAIIVQSTISLAHNLGLTVVAEGVEDEETLIQLQSFGCDFAQGFTVATPMNEAAAKVWLGMEASPPLQLSVIG